MDNKTKQVLFSVLLISGLLAALLLIFKNNINIVQPDPSPTNSIVIIDPTNPPIDPLPTETPTVDYASITATIMFKADKAIVNGDEELDKIYDFRDIALNNDLEIMVCGYVNSDDNTNLGMLLSTERANIVRDYLVTGGIDIDRISTYGFGNKDMLTESTSEDAWMNRRVVISFMTGK